MSRNSNKLNRQPDDLPEKEELQKNDTNQRSPDNPFGLSFVVPTEDVMLPTEGRYYPSSSPLHGLRTVEIKHMTAKEEDLLSNLEATNDQNIFNRLINGILTDKQVRSEDMLEEDKMAILLKARSTGYGNKYEAKMYCSACEKTASHEFDLDICEIKEAENKAEYDPENDCFTVELPMSKIKVSLRSLTDKDKEQIEKEKKKKKDLDIEFNATISMINRMMISANDIKDRLALSKLADILPAVDAKKIINFDKGIYPSLSTKQEIACSACGEKSESEAPLTWAFFRTDI